MTYIFELINKKHIEVEIVLASGRLPLKKDGWKFDWNKLIKEKNSKTYILRLKESSKRIEGIMQLKIENSMLIMDVIELAPHNIGSLNKRFDYVAGCLIAFGCRQSFEIKGSYKGFLTFITKTNLIDWYQNKYGCN